MKHRTGFVIAVAVGALMVAVPVVMQSQSVAKTTVLLCDGSTTVNVPELSSGRALDRGRAQNVADQLMTAWLQKRPGTNWAMPEKSGLAVFAMAQASPQKLPQNQQHEAYNRESPADQFVRKTELDKFVAEGKRVFHDADSFGGTIGVSCDMCHPDGSNTHAETYPKYQVQMQRVALLRDMINWCIEHPTKGKPLADGDPRLRAMEAYLMSVRSGKTMEPGKR